MKKAMVTRTVKLGVVGVDSGQLLICDPSYIESQFKKPDSKGKADHGHTIYKHKDDGSLWQFTYGEEPATERVNKFPGTYDVLIPKYGKCPNQLIKSGEFIETEFDPISHIPDNEFSYRGICKATNNNGGQLNFELGHPGVGVAFRSGFGDGVYDVFAEITDYGEYGERISKVWIELITDKEVKQMEELVKRQS